VRDNGGEYVSAGKQSHFRKPVSSVANKPTQDKRNLLIKDTLEYINSVLKQVIGLRQDVEAIEKQMDIIKEKLKELQQK